MSKAAHTGIVPQVFAGRKFCNTARCCTLCYVQATQSFGGAIDDHSTAVGTHVHYIPALPSVALRVTTSSAWNPPMTSESTQILTEPAASPTTYVSITKDTTASRKRI